MGFVSFYVLLLRGESEAALFNSVLSYIIFSNELNNWKPKEIQNIIIIIIVINLT